MTATDGTQPVTTGQSNTSRVAAGLLARIRASDRMQTEDPPPLAEPSQSGYHDTDDRGSESVPVAPSKTPSAVLAEEDITMKRRVDLAKQLRQAIKKSGLTRNQIAKQADVSYAIVHGFVAGTKDLRLETASKIAAVVGVELRARDGKR